MTSCSCVVFDFEVVVWFGLGRNEGRKQSLSEVVKVRAWRGALCQYVIACGEEKRKANAMSLSANLNPSM
jgi:hypothetical protein